METPDLHMAVNSEDSYNDFSENNVIIDSWLITVTNKEEIENKNYLESSNKGTHIVPYEVAAASGLELEILRYDNNLQETRSSKPIQVCNSVPASKLSENDVTKGLVNVKIMNYSFQHVPPDEQTKYKEILKFDKFFNFYQPQFHFKGYNHFKERESLFNSETIAYPCINKHSLNCSGVIKMKQGKIIEYLEHSCKNIATKRNLPQLDRNDTKTVLLQYNLVEAETEAVYNGFSYRKYLKNNYHTAYRCPILGCCAEIKLFPQTNLLQQIGTHNCTFNKSSDDDDEFVDVDKLPICVFENEDEPFLIYGGYLYHQIITDTIWSCIEAHKIGCKGLLHMKYGTVISVSEHTCLINKDSNKDMFLFQDRRTGANYAMHLGNIYKKCENFPDGQNKYLWNCTTNKCPGVLTTINNKVVSIVDHVCSHKDHIVEVRDPAIASKAAMGKETVDDGIELKEAKNHKGHSSKNFSNHHNILTKIEIHKRKLIPIFEDGQSLLIYNGFIYCPVYHQNTPIKTYLSWVCFNYHKRGCTGQIHLKQICGNNSYHYYASSVSTHTCFKYFMFEDLHFFQSSDAMKTYAKYQGCIYEKHWALNRDQNIYRWDCLGLKSETCQGILTTKNDKVLTVSRHNCNYENHDGAEGEENSCIVEGSKRQHYTDSTDLKIVDSDGVNPDTVKTLTKEFKQEDGITVEEMYVNLEDEHDPSVQAINDNSCQVETSDFRLDKLGRKRKTIRKLSAIDPKVCRLLKVKSYGADTDALKQVNILDFTRLDLNSEELKHKTEFPYNPYIAQSPHYYPEQLKFRSYTYLKQPDSSLSNGACVYLCSNKHIQNCPGLIRLQCNKMLEYTEHSCISGRESVNLAPALPKVDSKNETVLFYNNRLTGEKEAFFQCYTFTSPLDRDYFIIWSCMIKECPAEIKLFPRTCLLREIDKHSCSPVSHPFATCLEGDNSNDVKIQAEILDNADIEIEPRFINDSDDIDIKTDFINNFDEINRISNNASGRNIEGHSDGNPVKVESLEEMFMDEQDQGIFEEARVHNVGSHVEVCCEDYEFEEKYNPNISN